ncbi:MAG: UPF0280 family protein [Candidatus Lokiarchaeota archaeon]|nr:UPF0280 family protein [Candidatus Lokiarchaeota archaeon]
MKIYKHHFLEQESDVTIISESKIAIRKAKESLEYHRKILEKYLKQNNKFLTSFSSIRITTEFEIINLMSEASVLCEVGPMAAVAGALADIMLNRMKLEDDPDYLPAKIALVENGGEIAVDSEKDMKIALFAGYNELNLNIGFLIEKKNGPLGIGTSSATIGHAISLGQADAVTIFARDATLADAAATRVANLVKGVDVEKSIKNALDAAEDIEGVYGALISRENKVGQVGKLPKFFKIEGNKSLVLKDKFEGFFPGKYDILK